MRTLILGGLVAMALPASAVAKSPLPPGVTPLVPPSNSAANQYVENVPTASGGRPTVSVVGSGTRGSGSNSSSAGGSQVLSPSTRAALAQQGAAGNKTAAVARETAPRKVHRKSSRGGLSGVPGGGSSSGGSGSGGGSSASGTLLRSLTGIGSHGGLGAALPVALVVTALAVMGMALRRRRTG